MVSGQVDSGRAAHIALYLPDMAPGGVEIVFALLAASFVRRGHRVTLILDNATGPNLAHLVPEVRVIDLKAPRIRSAPLRLARCIRRERPDVLLSGMDMPNTIAVAVARLGGVPSRVVVCVQNILSIWSQRASGWQRRSLRWIAPWAYRFADSVVAASDYIARDLAEKSGVPGRKLVRIYNPVIPDILERAAERIDHPFFAPGSPPVILGIGRLVEQKDFATLIRAFALLRRRGSEARLVILGDGPAYRELTTLSETLGVAAAVSLPGFAANPYPYLRRAALFALSSAWEPFGVVLTEALACGTPIVSTDCPGAPSEILEGGRYGLLVPVGRPEQMAEAFGRVLALPPDPALLQQRARDFDLEAVASAFLEVLLGPSPTPHSLRARI